MWIIARIHQGLQLRPGDLVRDVSPRLPGDVPMRAARRDVPGLAAHATNSQFDVTFALVGEVTSLATLLAKTCGRT